MKPDSNAKSLFLSLIDLASESERNAYLDEQCGSNSALRQELLELLRHDREGGSFLAKQAFEPAATTEKAFHPLQAKEIGPYKLLEQIGEGGMGVVFVALQEKPIRRKVALKIIKPGMDSSQVIARFEAERQALAIMNHPHIAKVLDAGTTESGSPYFVMELVRGIPITHYCDRHKLDLRQRLELFVKVCHAVQHAHQKGVIHRDLKPSNILVELDDVRAVPKVIDFGVAKATHQQLTEHSLHTGLSQMVGTPLYMSPEQAQLNSQDVDTRSDVYALGVLLYELLTGGTPFDSETLKQAGFDEMRRIIREDEPPRPSSRISTLENKVASTVSESRHMDLRHWSSAMKRELDWVVMRSLEKDRIRRYQSASALAADVQRYLDGEPVEACPPSAMYRLSKFTRRYRVQTIAVVIGILGLLVTSVLSLLLLVRERELAQRKQSVQLKITNALATVSQLKGQVAGKFSDETLAQAIEQMQLAKALAETGPSDEPSRALIRQVSTELEQEQRERKLLAALESARHVKSIGIVDNRLNEEAFIRDMRAAIEAYCLSSEDDSAKEFATQIKYLSPKLREEFLSALEEWRGALLPPIGVRIEQTSDDRLIVKRTTDSVRKLVNLGSQVVGVGLGHDGPILDTSDMGLTQIKELLNSESGSLVRLKLVMKGASDSSIAEIHPDPKVAWLRAVVEASDPDPWRKRLREANDLFDDELKQSELIKLSKEAEVLSVGQPVSVLLHLAKSLGLAKAEEHARQLLKRLQHRNPNNFWVNFELGYRMQEGKPLQSNEAMRYYSIAKAMSPDSASVRLGLSSMLLQLEKPEEAIEECREALRLNPGWSQPHNNMGNALFKQSKFEEAVAEYREFLRLEPDYGPTYSNLAYALFMLGRFEESLDACHEAIRLQPDEKSAYNHLGMSLVALGKLDEAVTAYQEAIRLKPDFYEAYNNLGNAYIKLSRTNEAIAAFREAIRLKPDSVDTYNALGLSLLKLHKSEEAVTAFREAIRLRPNDFKLHLNLGGTLYERENFDEAVAEFRVTLRLQPDFAPAWDNLGLSLAKLGKIEEAVTAHQEAIRYQPDFAKAYANLGFSLGKLGKTGEAVTAYREAIRHRPGYLDAYVNLSSVLNRLGKHVEAMTVCREAIRMGPDDWALHLNLGIALIYNGDFDDGVMEYREAGRLQPHELIPVKNLVISLSVQKKHGEAYEVIRQFAEKQELAFGAEHKFTRAARLELANCASNWSWYLATDVDPSKRDPQKAVELARQAIDIDPKSSNYLNNLGVALYRADQWKESVETLEKADSMITGGDRTHRMFLAMAHWRLGNQEIARQRYTEGASSIAAKLPISRENYSAGGVAGTSVPGEPSRHDRFRDEAEQLMNLNEVERNELIVGYYAKTDVTNPKQLKERGQWYLARNEYPFALDDFNAALSLQPDSKDSTLWRLRATAYLKLARDVDAVADYSKALEINLNDVDSMSMRATAYSRLGQFDLALADRSKVIELQPLTNYRFYERAMVHREQGEYELALADLERALQIANINDSEWFPRAEAYVLSGDIYQEDLRQYDKALEQYTKAIELEPSNANYLSKREAATNAKSAAQILDRSDNR